MVQQSGVPRSRNRSVPAMAVVPLSIRPRKTGFERDRLDEFFYNEVSRSTAFYGVSRVNPPSRPPQMDPTGDTNLTESLLNRVAAGDSRALGELLDLHRPYLRRVIDLRMQTELRTRVDPSDVVQDTQCIAAQRIDDFLERRPTTFRIWLRRKALQQLEDERRRHVVAQKRSVRREHRFTSHSSAVIAHAIVGEHPGHALSRAELVSQIKAFIDELPGADREMLELRHAEGLSNAEVAELLELDPATARKRYGRALRRLDQKVIASGLHLDYHIQ